MLKFEENRWTARGNIGTKCILTVKFLFQETHTKVFAAMVLRAAAENLVHRRAIADRYMYMHV